jgi:hypothetical protein
MFYFYIYTRYLHGGKIWLFMLHQNSLMINFQPKFFSKIYPHMIDRVMLLFSHVKLVDVASISVKHNLQWQKRNIRRGLHLPRASFRALKASKWCLSWSLCFQVHLLYVHISYILLLSEIWDTTLYKNIICLLCWNILLSWTDYKSYEKILTFSRLF